ncbi:MAG: hypothetical protein D6759_04990, partial [Chloroflexi bacterium]
MRKRKLDRIASVILGILILGGGLVCAMMSRAGQEDLKRWKAAPVVQEAGDLRTLGEGRDVALTGAISSDAPVAREGLVLYTYWEEEVRYRYESGGQRRRYRSWQLKSSVQPPFPLLLDGQSVTVRSARAVLYNERVIRVGSHAQLKGFAPGDQVTVMGTVGALTTPPEVEAEVVCGGDRRACLNALTTTSILMVVLAGVIVLAGAG